MPFVHSLLGANLFIFIYLAYPREVFVTYASFQLVASSVLILLETPLLQHFLSNHEETYVPRVALRLKFGLALLCGLWLAVTGIDAAPSAVFVCLLTCVPTSWQITGRSHDKFALSLLLLVRMVLLASAFMHLPMTAFLALFSIVSSGIATLSADRRAPRLPKPAYIHAARAFVSKISYAIRPGAESIAFNLATLFIMSRLPASDASTFFVFLRVIASAVSLAQNALHTDSVSPQWQGRVQRFGPAILVSGAVLAAVALFGQPTPYITAGAFALGAPIVIVNQYFGSYRAKLLNLHKLDLLNGLLFSAGLAMIAGLSLVRKDFPSIAYTYLIVEAVIGLNSHRVTSRFS